VWGIDESSREIWISSERYLIRENLYSALVCLRNNTETRRLWVDAICIEQDILVERAWQVQNMVEIYSRASKVLIWLGVDDKLGLLFGIIKALGAT
jgi:hypothetical protein